MFKLAVTTLMALAATVHFAAARNCTPGLNYCGKGLLSIGKYEDQILLALEAGHLPPDAAHVESTVFTCLGGANGDISVLQFCSHACIDGGSGHSDYCSA